MSGRMGKALALRFCDMVSGPGLPGHREWLEWAEAEGFHRSIRSSFWGDLAMWVRDCDHDHKAFVLYRMAYEFASRLRNEQEFVDGIGEVFRQCAERFGVSERDIRKEDE
jgi:hypothetical protein